MKQREMIEEEFVVDGRGDKVRGIDQRGEMEGKV
jgi:hypothetical protein